jgi:hypothetical protein
MGLPRFARMRFGYAGARLAAAIRTGCTSGNEAGGSEFSRGGQAHYQLRRRAVSEARRAGAGRPRAARAFTGRGAGLATYPGNCRGSIACSTVAAIRQFRLAPLAGNPRSIRNLCNVLFGSCSMFRGVLSHGEGRTKGGRYRRSQC